MEGGLEAMAALGWQQVQEEGEEVLTLAKGAATMAQVRRWGLVQGHAAPCKVWLCSRGKQGAWAGSRALPSWDPRSYRQPAICPAFSGMCCAGTTAAALSALRMVVFSPPPLPQVRCILEAQQEFKKNDRQLKRAKSSASLPGSDEQAALRAQIEADRCGAGAHKKAGPWLQAAARRNGRSQAPCRPFLPQRRLERAARSPVAKDSVAQALPGEGARIATAKDCGIQCEC